MAALAHIFDHQGVAAGVDGGVGGVEVECGDVVHGPFVDAAGASVPVAVAGGLRAADAGGVVDVGVAGCEGGEFIKGSAQVNTTIASALLGVDYKKVYTLICTECGYLQWSMQPPKRMLDESLFS